jgi:hypothetical protein
VKLQGCLRPVLQHAEKKMNIYLQQIYINDFIDKSHFKYLKYILGVNKKSTNLVVWTWQIPSIFLCCLVNVKILV